MKELNEHLGHTIQESLSMEGDAQRARACFMARASDVRDNLFFAHPQQKVQAIQLYCSDAYGSMLWEYDRQYSESFFKAWNIVSVSRSFEFSQRLKRKGI